MFQINKESLNEIVNYIIMPPNHNISQTAEHFHLARDSVTKYLSRLSKVGDEYFDLEKAQAVNDTLERLLIESRKESGSKGHRPVVFTTSEALDLRLRNLYMGVSLRELAKLYGCSHMTIYNAIMSLDENAVRRQDEKVKELMDSKQFQAKAMGEFVNKWTR